MEGRSLRTPVLDERGLRRVLLALGLVHSAIGAWQLIAPGSFYDEVGRYGAENTHYVGDVGAFVLAFGIGLLLAAGRPSWRAPVLVVGAVWFGLHGLNHLLDIDENLISDARGVLDTALFALGAVLLAWLASVSERLERLRR